MQYRDLRDFLAGLEAEGDLVRVDHPVDPRLEMTEICDRTLRRGGPALLFRHPAGHDTPVLGNLFGTARRVARAMGAEDTEALREIGRLLAFLKEPDPPRGMRDAWKSLPIFKKVLDMAPRTVRSAPCQEIVREGADVDLAGLPVQTCWPGDAGPLITWGLVVTRGPHRERANMGIYRQQVIGPDRVIMRWLGQRGGALDFRDWSAAHPGEPFPVAVALGADPATTLAAVTPIPDTLSEHAFAGLLRGGRTELARCLGSDLQVPARAEIVLEGHIHPDDTAPEGPFGDHTGYYNEVERFPVLTVERITSRHDPIYHSTYTGRPPDEPAVLGLALNEVFVPLLQKQFPEIADFHLPAEGCSYRVAVVALNKQYPGHAKRVMLALLVRAVLQEGGFFIDVVRHQIEVAIPVEVGEGGAVRDAGVRRGPRVGSLGELRRRARLGDRQSIVLKKPIGKVDFRKLIHRADQPGVGFIRRSRLHLLPEAGEVEVRDKFAEAVRHEEVAVAIIVVIGQEWRPAPARRLHARQLADFAERYAAGARAVVDLQRVAHVLPHSIGGGRRTWTRGGAARDRRAACRAP